MLKPKFLCLFQRMRLKILVVWKALDVSFSVVQVLSLVNIEQKLRKSMFSKCLCLPSKVQKIFFFVYFHVFWPEKSICGVLDKTLDVRDIDADVFIYGVNSTCHIELKHMVTKPMDSLAKSVMLEKLGLVTLIKYANFITHFVTFGRISL